MSDITIPPEALEATAMEMAPHPWSMYTEEAKEHFRGKARAACLAMLEAWPGMQYSPPFNGADAMVPACIHLPITENSNG